MKMHIHLVIAVAIAASATDARAQDHGHLNAGAESQIAGSKLIFANGQDFATNSLYVKTLTFTNGATYAGYFQGNTTLTVLPATPDFAGPDPFAPALGSYIFAQLVSLKGPAGGEFAFWDTGATTPTFSIKSGETGTNLWRLTEADGSPGTDPYGHIHGRRWTLNKPGLYVLGLRLFDLSSNGPDSGPIHAASEILYTYVQAGVNVLSVALTANEQPRIRFVAPLGTDWQLEASDSLNPGVAWTPVGDAVTGSDIIREALDEAPVAQRRFYRLRAITP
jgi:hypothetical protein